MNIPSQAAGCLGLLIGKVAFQAGRCLRNDGADEVHDVRVAIRRLQQALRLFEGWLPEGQPRKIRRRSKAVLKAAGQVRDLDIAIELAESAGLELPDAIREALAARRQGAANHLSTELTRLLESEWSAKWRSRLELESAGEKNGAAMPALARELLPDLAEEFIASGARLAGHPKSKRKMHAFRLSAKRFRYSLEPFSAVYGDALKPRLKAVKTVQDVLGKLSDASATRRILKRLGAPPAALARLRAAEAARLEEFRTVWPGLFEESAPAKWRRFLERPAPDGKAVRKAATPVKKTSSKATPKAAK